MSELTMLSRAEALEQRDDLLVVAELAEEDGQIETLSRSEVWGTLHVCEVIADLTGLVTGRHWDMIFRRVGNQVVLRFTRNAIYPSLSTEVMSVVLEYVQRWIERRKERLRATSAEEGPAPELEEIRQLTERLRRDHGMTGCVQSDMVHFVTLWARMHARTTTVPISAGMVDGALVRIEIPHKDQLFASELLQVQGFGLCDHPHHRVRAVTKYTLVHSVDGRTILLPKTPDSARLQRGARIGYDPSNMSTIANCQMIRAGSPTAVDLNNGGDAQ